MPRKAPFAPSAAREPVTAKDVALDMAPVKDVDPAMVGAKDVVRDMAPAKGVVLVMVAERAAVLRTACPAEPSSTVTATAFATIASELRGGQGPGASVHNGMKICCSRSRIPSP